MGAAGAGAVLRSGLDGPSRPVYGAETLPILPLTSTSEVFVPPRGRAFQKFSFDFPEPSIEFRDIRFGFLVFSRENAYAIDASGMTTAATDGGLEIRSEERRVGKECRSRWSRYHSKKNTRGGYTRPAAARRRARASSRSLGGIGLVRVFFFQAEDGIRAGHVTGVQTCALPIWRQRLGSTTARCRGLQRRPLCC